LKYLHVEVQKMLEHIVDSSSTMSIGISGISFHIARVRNVGAVFPEVDLLRTNHCVFTCNPSNPYTDHIMYMPGPVKLHTKDEKEIMRIIYEKKELFIVSLKGRIPKSKWNLPIPGTVLNSATVINFPPIFRNIKITTNSKTIGKPMYDFMNEHEFPVNKKDRKLTQLLNTNGEFMSFKNYYLWFLLDSCYFEIDGVHQIYVFEINKAFNTFGLGFIKNKLESKDEVGGFFFKIGLNGSYGFDGMNEEKFTKCQILRPGKTNQKQISSNFVSLKRFFDEVVDEGGDVVREAFYQVQMRPSTFHCKTALTQAFFTLDNSKFWLLTFLNNFMFRCLDMDRMHYIEGDTDSLYWVVSGKITNHPEIDRKQGSSTSSRTRPSTTRTSTSGS
jgi:hypothetical protein